MIYIQTYILYTCILCMYVSTVCTYIIQHECNIYASSLHAISVVVKKNTDHQIPDSYLRQPCGGQSRGRAAVSS